jgi:hypothetical protein
MKKKMNLPLNTQEEIAVKQIAQQMELSSEAVVIQAIRLYQLWRMNQIKLIWPRVINSKCEDLTEDIQESSQMVLNFD